MFAISINRCLALGMWLGFTIESVYNIVVLLADL